MCLERNVHILASHSTNVGCVNFIHDWQDLKSTPSNKFFEKLCMAISFTFRVFVRILLRGSRRRNIVLYFVLLDMYDLWVLTVASPLIS